MMSELIEAAAGKCQPVDTYTRPFRARTDIITFRIKSDLFKITVLAEIGRSDITAVKVIPERCNNGAADRLLIIYRAHVHLTDPREPRDFNGASILKVRRVESNVVISGRYWTDSRWHQGLAEAGRVSRVYRLSPDFNHHIPNQPTSSSSTPP
jgi:hypothetical protein